MADQASTVAAWQAMLAQVQAIGGTGANNPTITGFAATPGTINAGQQSSLDATITDAVTVALDGVTIPGLPQFVAPTVTHAYTLTATGALGTTPASSQVTVAVAGAPPPVGSLSTLAANTARNCGTYVPASAWGGKESARTDYSGLAGSTDGKVRFFGGGHGQGQMTDVREFNTATAAWSSLYPSIAWAAQTAANLDVGQGRWISVNHPTARHTYNMNVIMGRKFYMMGAYGQVDYVPAGGSLPYGGCICWCDLDTGAWSFSQRNGVPWFMSAAAAYDPIGGKIIVIGPTSGAGTAGGFWLYDPATDAAAVLVPKSGMPTGGGHDLIYYPPNDRFYSILKAGGAVYEIALNRTTPSASTVTLLTTTGSKPPASSNDPVAYAYDDRAGIIGGHVVNGIFYAFHPPSKVWTAKTMLYESAPSGALPTQVFHCLEFDKASGCFVFLENIATRKATWAYRYG